LFPRPQTTTTSSSGPKSSSTTSRTAAAARSMSTRLGSPSSSMVWASAARIPWLSTTGTMATSPTILAQSLGQGKVC